MWSLATSSKIPTEELKVWEVFFDNQDQRTSGDGSTPISRPPPRRSDPLVFDLNRDGKLDTTDGTQTGNGQMDGSTVLFDIDPTRESPEKVNFRSQDFRPGNGRCPAYQVALSFMTVVPVKTLQEMDVGMKIVPKVLPLLYMMTRVKRSDTGVVTPTLGTRRKSERRRN